VRALLVAVVVALLAPSPARGAELDDAVGVPRIDLAGSLFGSDDTFVRRLGHGFRMTVRPVRFAGFDFVLAGFPDGGEADLTAQTLDLRGGPEVVPALSRVLSMTHIAANLAPLVGRVRAPGGGDGGEVAWYWIVGAGAISTRDDMALTQSPCLELATQAERQADANCSLVDQLHPAFVVGSGLRLVLGPGLLVGFEGRLTVYPEEHFVGGDTPLTSVMRTFWGSVYVGGSIPLKPPR